METKRGRSGVFENTSAAVAAVAASRCFIYISANSFGVSFDNKYNSFLFSKNLR
ncbi:MAG TPA: hypothetical protein VJP58_00205 [Candidatus Nitrosocosmicus sp.]|nr:hypothetical protein [Candidatus Nitrosocosmicus sp.]